MTKKKTKKKMGRPRIEISWKEFDKLCALQCTLLEIASWFNCSDDTIENRVKEIHGVTFSEYFEQKRGAGKVALRRLQWQQAEKGNITMLIWLGKQNLDQHDKQSVAHSVYTLDQALDEYELEEESDENTTVH